MFQILSLPGVEGSGITELFMEAITQQHFYFKFYCRTYNYLKIWMRDPWKQNNLLTNFVENHFLNL